MTTHLPPIREGENSIGIDQKKGKWPCLGAMRLDDGRLVIKIDSNEGGQVIGEGVGIGMLVLSRKKARALREFMERTEP